MTNESDNISLCNAKNAASTILAAMQPTSLKQVKIDFKDLTMFIYGIKNGVPSQPQNAPVKHEYVQNAPYPPSTQVPPVGINTQPEEELGVCSKCQAPNKLSKAGKKYCSNTCWLPS
jgi:hypothetical protein|tara:strand:+ start:5039 stop:5389 length:351 start_codon:yes stop_codon:yes gene_type:complete